MNILGFIDTQYPIKDKLRARLENPYRRIEAMDDLPYDTIGPDENGKITKLVEIDDERWMSVIELIGMTRDEVVATGDGALLTVWDAYMSQIQLEDLNIADFMECVRQYQAIERKRKEQLDVLSI